MDDVDWRIISHFEIPGSKIGQENLARCSRPQLLTSRYRIEDTIEHSHEASKSSQESLVVEQNRKLSGDRDRKTAWRRFYGKGPGKQKA